MKSNFQIQLSWKDVATGKQREPRLNLPIAFGREFALLIPEILGDIFGQVAYSGYFGYFIGLSALKPGKHWRLLGIGYLT